MFQPKKRLIEQTAGLDVQVLSKLTNGTYEVKRGSRTDLIEKEYSQLVLNGSNRFKLVKSKTGYGERYFFQCECNRRVKRIYFTANRWACRYCHNLTYQTRNLTKSKLELYKVNTRIDILLKELGLSLNDTDKPITKPRWMHQKTFEKKLDEFSWNSKEYSRMKLERQQKLYDRLKRWLGE